LYGAAATVYCDSITLISASIIIIIIKTNFKFLYRPDALPEGEYITSHGLVYPKLTWGSSNFVSDHLCGLRFGVANALVSINAVALHQARLVLGWVTAL